MCRIVLAFAVAVVACGAGSPAVATAAPWRWPVAGQVVARFSASDAEPFARGRRRGIAIAAGRGAVVRSACSGDVAFAGPVGRAGVTVSVRCGRLRATYQGLATTSVRQGEPVATGASLGMLGRAGVLRLGARREVPRAALHRYVDPLTLLRTQLPITDPACGVCPGRAPRGPVDRPRPRPLAIAPPPRPVELVSRSVAPQPVTSGVPSAAVWAGIGLLALGVPPGLVIRRRRRARRAGRMLARPLGG